MPDRARQHLWDAADPDAEEQAKLVTKPLLAKAFDGDDRGGLRYFS